MGGGGKTRYFVVVTGSSNRPVTVVRYHYERGVEVRFDAWRHGRWEEAEHYASIVLLGDPPADEVTEEEARVVMAELDARRKH